MTRRRLNALKRQATKYMLLGFAMLAVATIPVVFHWGTDHTGSVFCYLLGGIVVFDSISRLIKLNTRGQYYVNKR